MHNETVPTNVSPRGEEHPPISNEEVGKIRVERRRFISLVQTRVIVSTLFLNNSLQDLLKDIQEKARIREYRREDERVLWARLENQDGTNPKYLCNSETTLEKVIQITAETKQQLVAFVIPSCKPCITALEDKRNKVPIAIATQHHEIVSPERSPATSNKHPSSSRSDESLRTLFDHSLTLEESKPQVPLWTGFCEEPKPRVPVWAGFYNNTNVDSHPAHPFLTCGTLKKDSTFTEPWRGDPIVLAAVGNLILHRLHQSNQRTELAERSQQTGQAARVAGRRRSLPSKRRSSNPTTSTSTSVSARLENHLSTSRHSRSTRREHCAVCPSWSRLMVFNTTSRHHQELSKPDCVTRCGLELEPWDYNGVQLGMVTHNDTYKIIMAFEYCVMVYDSTPNNWSFYQCQRPTPFGLAEEHPHLTENYGSDWRWVAASAMVSGRLHCADMIGQSTEEFTLRLFEVDYTEEAWSLRGTFNIRKRHYPLAAVRDTIDDIRFFDIVECMGNIYAIIPARTDEYLTTSFTSELTKTELQCEPSAGYCILPVQFHILRLDSDDGDDRAHRVLRMVVPQDRSMRLVGEVLLESYVNHHSCGDTQQVVNWLSTAAVGSVIFLSIFSVGDGQMLQYMLEYDIDTGESKTGIIGEDHFCTVTCLY